LVVSDSSTIAVQVNGKLRATMQVPNGTSKEDIHSRALSLEPVVRALEGKAPKKVIVVPNRIVNIVA
jgi:leucyl-tRNA synthetase